MAREINRAEAWETIHQAYSQINFNSFDYDSIKNSLLDYLKIYFPENFNDYIESSEFIAILELFAYVGELLAYRIDLNAHENFLATAQRKESVLRLVKLISYKAHRNIPARGLVKITSVQTTEQVFDSTGINLANVPILWNDSNNVRWKEQFILIMNKIMKQTFGSVSPQERVQVDDVIFEKYTLNNSSITSDGKTAISFNVTVSDTSLPMELVPVDLTENGPIEKRPEYNSNFTLLYANDGLGDGSDTTGFLAYVKQGTLFRRTEKFDGITPNITYVVNENNINETDVWINNVDPETHKIIDQDPTGSVVAHNGAKYGEWYEVDNSRAQNIAFNIDQRRHKYEIEPLDHDQIKIVFGDGEFADIPSGTFDIWYRVSGNTDAIIPQNAIINNTANIPYVDAAGNPQTLTITYSLINSLTNGLQSEKLEHIRSTAPAIHYTQHRMVNGADYNLYPLQDSTILKIKTVNRTYVGDSRYLHWHDPTGTYENVKIFGDDLALYWIESDTPDQGHVKEVRPFIKAEPLVNDVLEPLLSESTIFAIIASLYQQFNPTVPATQMRKEFYRTPQGTQTESEYQTIVNQIDVSYTNGTDTVNLYFDVVTDTWSVSDPGTASSKLIFTITPSVNKWIIKWAIKYMVAHSEQIRFWTSNESESVIDYQTLNVIKDNITVLKANINADGTGLLQQNKKMMVIKQINSELPTEQGLPDEHRLIVLPEDINGDGIADDLSQTELLGNQFVYFYRKDANDRWKPIVGTPEVQALEANDVNHSNYKKLPGRFPLNFAWYHYSTYFNLIDPAPTNIHDMFVITNGFYKQMKLWLSGDLVDKPKPPSPTELKSTYAQLLNSKMISDEVVLHPGRFKILFGDKAERDLQCKFKVVRSVTTTMNDSDIKLQIVSAIKEFFDISYFEFGETLYITELLAYVHFVLKTEIDSIVIVPVINNGQFGDLFEIKCQENEIFIPDIRVDMIELVNTLTTDVLNPN